jgi:hypothetical protein
MSLITIDWDMEDDNFNAVYELAIGDVFKYTKNYESLILRLERDRPSYVPTFDVRAIAPGTPSYSLYAPTALIVVDKVAVACERVYANIYSNHYGECLSL